MTAADRTLLRRAKRPHPGEQLVVHELCHDRSAYRSNRYEAEARRAAGQAT